MKSTLHFTTDSLSPALAEKLSKLLGMTDSSHDGEALNAVRLANRVLVENKLKLTWQEALQPGLPSPDDSERQRRTWDHDTRAWPREMSWQEAVRFCATYSYLLNQRSRDFITGLSYYTHRPSEAQLGWLENCVGKLLAKGLRP